MGVFSVHPYTKFSPRQREYSDVLLLSPTVNEKTIVGGKWGGAIKGNHSLEGTEWTEEKERVKEWNDHRGWEGRWENVKRWGGWLIWDSRAVKRGKRG